MKRFGSIVFWSVISAAFIGPGTVTTAASAGAATGYALLWALVFSTAACLVLQEAAARLTVVSGRDLGRALRERFAGGRGWLVPVAAGGSIVLGCAAYEAGNILGGVAGARLALPYSQTAVTAACGAVAALLLWHGSPRRVAQLLAVAVAVMGAAFLVTAVSLAPEIGALARGALIPSVPAGAGLLVLGLVGTTVVPYNLFLGSGLAAGERLEDMRFGLSVAVVLGGLISMAVVVVGAAVSGELTYPALAAVLAERLGDWAADLFAWGLFAAGLSSAITAPLAAAVTVRSIAKTGDAWTDRDWRYRGVWLGVVAIGVGFGIADVRPIPAIILAQALNGLLLPLVAVFLLVAVNDRRLMADAVNGPLSNAAMSVVTAVTVLLGLLQLTKAASNVTGFSLPGSTTLTTTALLLTAALAWPVSRWIRSVRS